MFPGRFTLSILLACSMFATLSGQEHQARYAAIDVLHYRFEIELYDSTNRINGITDVEILFKKSLDRFELDLVNRHGNSITGMKVERVTENGKVIPFLHTDDRITLNIPLTTPGSTRKYRIVYSGVPVDGLIIARNKFGERTFFGDNWPDRAHYWLPVVDHPSDKATVEFLVDAPGHYEVVSVGTNMKEERSRNRVVSYWKTSYPLPTKLMVIGVSHFSVQHLTSTSGIPVSSWVFPQNQEAGFYDYSIATRPLDFFESYIAPYPYCKLANVQSKTVYGGMENASCIFYNENSVTGKRTCENLFAHEIAHQWFGDAVSELDWHHIWLSEGFATYLTDLYIEHTYGREAFVASMQREREEVIRFARSGPSSIVDSTLPVSTALLNRNTYQKAGWVLHMLRHKLGDTQFQACIRSFYDQYKFSNALTEDFRDVAEAVSGTELDLFFRQWFYTPGHLLLSYRWTQKGKTITLVIRQHQAQQPFQFPLEIEIVNRTGKSFRKTLEIKKSENSYTFRLPFCHTTEIVPDPGTWLLYETYSSP